MDDEPHPYNPLMFTNYPEHYGAEGATRPGAGWLSAFSQNPRAPVEHPEALKALYDAAHQYGRVPTWFEEEPQEACCRNCYAPVRMSRVSNATVLLVRPGYPSETAEPYPWAHCWGNNLAVRCPACSEYPVLLTARTGWRGSRQDTPSHCPGCRAAVWMLSPVEAGVEVDEVRMTYAPPSRPVTLS